MGEAGFFRRETNEKKSKNKKQKTKLMKSQVRGSINLSKNFFDPGTKCYIWQMLNTLRTPSSTVKHGGGSTTVHGLGMGNLMCGAK